jgi:hypothetical protein
MGFNNCHLPNIESLSKEFELKGLEQFYEAYRNYDSWSGDTKSMEFLESKVKEYELQQISMVDKGKTE